MKYDFKFNIKETVTVNFEGQSFNGVVMKRWLEEEPEYMEAKDKGLKERYNVSYFTPERTLQIGEYFVEHLTQRPTKQYNLPLQKFISYIEFKELFKDCPLTASTFDTWKIVGFPHKLNLMPVKEYIEYLESEMKEQTGEYIKEAKIMLERLNHFHENVMVNM